MKILVTGAHGKVGRALVPALIRAGHDVRASDLTRRPQWDRLDDPRLDWRSHLRGPRVLLKGLRDLAQHDRNDDEADRRSRTLAGQRTAFGVPGGE